MSLAKAKMMLLYFILTICNTMTNNILLYFWLCVCVCVCVCVMGRGELLMSLTHFWRGSHLFLRIQKTTLHSHIARILTFSRQSEAAQYFPIINIFLYGSFLLQYLTLAFIQLDITNIYFYVSFQHLYIHSTFFTFNLHLEFTVVYEADYRFISISS